MCSRQLSGTLVTVIDIEVHPVERHQSASCRYQFLTIRLIQINLLAPCKAHSF